MKMVSLQLYALLFSEKRVFHYLSWHLNHYIRNLLSNILLKFDNRPRAVDVYLTVDVSSQEVFTNPGVVLEITRQKKTGNFIS
jgi:hypothetical protein